MSTYRRARIAGGTYFFTVVTHRRRPVFSMAEARTMLRSAIHEVRGLHPFVIDAWVLLPDHLHCIWTLPPGDMDYSIRWGKIKAGFSRRASDLLYDESLLGSSRKKKRESSVWQRRFWEHTIGDERDLRRHMDYIHYNPVKHGLVENVRDWPYSTFHRLVQQGIYSQKWGADTVLPAKTTGE